jgi:hypothetical protein
MNQRDRIILWLGLGVLVLWGVHWLGASREPAPAVQVQDQYLSFNWPKDTQVGSLIYDRALVNTNESVDRHSVTEDGLTLDKIMERIRQIAGYEYCGGVGETMVLRRRRTVENPDPFVSYNPRLGVVAEPAPSPPGGPPAPVVSATSAPWQYLTFRWPAGTKCALFYFSPQDIDPELHPPPCRSGPLEAVLFRARQEAGFDFFAAAGDTVILRRLTPAHPSPDSLDISNMWVIPNPPAITADEFSEGFELIRIVRPKN